MSKNESKTGGKNLTSEDVVWSISEAERQEALERARSLHGQSRTLRFESARFTAQVVAAGMIGEDRVWASQDAYAAAIGTSKSNVSGLKALGAVILATGITPDHADYSRLSDGAGSLGAYVRGQQKAGKPITLTGAKKALSAVQKAADAKKALTASNRATASAGGKSPESGTASGMVAVEGALDVIRRTMGTLTAEEARTLANSLTTLLSETQAHVKSVASRKADKAA